MTISTELRKAGPFTGNGVTTAFPFSFKVFAATDVTVTRADTLGAETGLVLNTDFTVALNADQDAAPGGTVTLAAPLSTGYLLVVSSAVPNLQPTDITNNGGFYPRVIEDALDRHVAQIQQIDEKVGRALKVAVTSPLGDQALPSPVAGMLIGWNESKDGLKNYAPIGGTLLGQQLAAANGSSLVGFQQAGTGAVVRTSQDKLLDTMSVADFGASPLASASVNTAAFVAALTAADIQGGATVDVPAGLYLINKVHLTGMAFGLRFARGAVIKAATAIDSILSFSNCTVAVDGAEIDGDSKAARGIAATVGGALVVRSSTFRNFRSTDQICAAVFATTLTRYSVENCEISNCEAVGNGVIGDGTGASRAIYGSHCGEFRAQSNTISDIYGEEGDAIQSLDCTATFVIGNRITGYSRRGIKVQSPDSVVSGNLLFENAHNSTSPTIFAAINVIDDRSNVHGNIIHCLYTPRGVFVSGDNHTVSSNTIMSAATGTSNSDTPTTHHGIVLSGDRNRAIGNIIDQAIQGIFSLGNHNVVSGNTITDSGTFGIQFGVESGTPQIGGVISGNNLIVTVAGRMPLYAVSVEQSSGVLFTGNTFHDPFAATNHMVRLTESSSNCVVTNNVGNSEFSLANTSGSITHLVHGNLNPDRRHYSTVGGVVPLGEIGVTTQAATAVGTLSRALPVYNIQGVLQGYVPIHATVT